MGLSRTASDPTHCEPSRTGDWEECCAVYPIDKLTNERALTTLRHRKAPPTTLIDSFSPIQSHLVSTELRCCVLLHMKEEVKVA